MSLNGNIFLIGDNVGLTTEVFETMLSREGCRIERIISRGQSSPEGFWYDQKEYEWVILLQGQAILEFEQGETITLNAGDYINIPAGRKHRVQHTSTNPSCIWLAVFSTGRETGTIQQPPIELREL